MRPLYCAALAAGAVVAALYLAKRKEGFVSERAKQIHSAAKPLFSSTDGNPAFTAYKQVVRDGDVVQYSGMKDLWKKGRFTPEGVQGTL